ncbi:MULTISPECIES: hypothetical protein [unclassified Mycobacterium]|uniref:hypothetical protein n=1 Tax=unclassified Mycobacterium TaxID=2642494 RepID=UPI0029C68F5E|nr:MULTISPECIES: hypothetical protein [unclassified Mycobacterium]
MTIARFARGFLASAALAAGLAIGVAANASAQPTQPDKDADFLQCLVDHDGEGVGVCCVFYGGDYDERNDACYYDWAEEKAPEARPTKPVLTLPQAPIVAVASRA